MLRISVITALTLGLLLTSCSKSEAATAAGSYGVDVAKTVEGVLKNTPGADKMPAPQKEQMTKMLEGTFSKMIMTLNSDLTFSGTSEATIAGQTKKSTTKGTWAIDKGAVTMNTTHEDGKEKKSTQKGTYKDGNLEMALEQGGMKITLYLKKK